MKKKCVKITAAVLAALIAAGTTGLLIMFPQKRFEAEMIIDSFSGSADISETAEKNLTLKNVDVSDLEKNGYTVNQSLLLVNGEHRLADNFSAQIGEYKDSGVVMNRCALSAFEDLSEAVSQKYNENIYVMSSYRTAEEQAEILSQQGSDTAMPSGSSEHQTGLALDVYFNNFAGEGIIKCDAGQFINTNCQDYGFIIRYPQLKKSVTGISYEPWHIRYVGQPHAKIIAQEHETLEEYYDLLEYGKFYEFENYVITHQKGEKLKVPEGKNTVISSDNCGGYVITSET